MSATPQRLGKYELLQQLGRGAVGETWKAHDLQLRRDVAVKILHNDLQSDPHFLTRFAREGQNIASLHHANIVQVHEINSIRTGQGNETKAYIAMEFIEGQTLGEYLRTTSHRGSFPPVAQIVYLIQHLAAAVDYAHQKNIVHGNIKPSNILLNMQDTSQFETGEPMLSDFGLPQLLGPNVTISSPAYMAPEQARGLPAVGRSDSYALGVLLYEICTGKQPFRDESSVAVMMQHINTLPTPPILINPHIPLALSEIILRALAKDATARFSSATALASAVAEACASTKSIQGQVNISTELMNTTNPPRARGSLLGVSQPLEDPEPFPTRISQPLSESLPGIQQSGTQHPPMPTFPPAVPAPQISQPFLPAATQVSRPMPQLNQLSQPSLPAISQISRPLPKLPPQQQELVRQYLPSLPEIIKPAEPPRVQHQTHPPAFSAMPAYQPQESPALLPPPTPTMKKSRAVPPQIALVAVVLLALLVSSLLIAAFVRSNSAGPNANLPNAPARQVFFQDDPQGINVQLRIDLQNIAAAPSGKMYFAWLNTTDRQSLPLGPLTMQGDKASLLYKGDGKHTNLLSITQGVTITQEESSTTPAQPSGKVVYQGTFDSTVVELLRTILYVTPNFPGNQSVAKGMLETIKSMNDKAGSIVDSLQDTHDYDLAKRQAIRIIEMLDGTEAAKSSGDLPANLIPQLNTQVGLLTVGNQTGFVDTLARQVTQVKMTASKNTKCIEHANNVENAIADLNDWLKQIRQDTIQILKASDLTDPAMLTAAQNLKQLANDAYTGRTIPPNQSPLPVLGSAGAQQAYVEAQYMAILDLQAQ
jgi:serine/threonine protein kinase